MNIKNKLWAMLGVLIVAAIAIGISAVQKQDNRKTDANLSSLKQMSEGNIASMQSVKVATGTSVEVSDKVVTLMANLQYPAYGPGIQKGYLGDLLKKKLGITVSWGFDFGGMLEYADYKPDMWQWRGGNDCYTNIKKGTLVNLEEEIESHPEVYRKYRKVIKYIKKETYKRTGKKGIYTFPMELSNFDNVHHRNGDIIPYSVSIMADSDHIKESLALLTYAASDEGIMNFVYGPKNENWKKQKGKYVVMMDWTHANYSEDGKPYWYSEANEEKTYDYYYGKPVIALVGNLDLAANLVKRTNKGK